MKFYWTRETKKTTTHRSNQQIKCQSNKRGLCFPKALWSIHCKIIYSSTTTTLSPLGGKKPSKTQINQKAIFQYVKFLLFYNLSIKNKIPINQLQTKMHVPACICSLFAHYLSLSTFNITLQPFEANRDKSTCKAECICLYS